MPRSGAFNRPSWSRAASVVFAGAFALGCRVTPKHPEAPGAPGARTLATSAVGFVGPARWFPVADTGDGALSEADPDGSVRSIEHGLRLVEHRDGRLERGSDVLPAGKQVGALRLPSRVGGGYLFFATQDRATLLYRSAGWTERVLPVVRLPFETNTIKVGFDRIYAVANQTHAVVAVDPGTGAVVPLGALPTSPAYGGLAFSDGWLGAVEVDIRGVLVTFDAGLDWHALRLPFTPPGVSEKDGRIVLGTARGAYALLPSGELARVDGASSEAVFGEMAAAAGVELDDTPARPLVLEPAFRTGLLGARPLEVAVVRGYPVTNDEAVVAANGALARVSLKDGSILAIVERAFPAGSECQGVRLGRGIGFVCGEDRGSTRVYSYGAPLALEPEIEFGEPRYVAPSGNGALVIRGPCASRAGAAASIYCVRSADGILREINVEGDLGAERVVGLGNGDIAVLAPPRLGAQGFLHIVDRAGKSTTTVLTLSALSPDVRDLVTRGFWLDGMVELQPGVLGGWVAGAQHAGPSGVGSAGDGNTDFVGIRVPLDGKVRAGPVQSGLEHSSFSGSFAFVLDEHGGGIETVDLGATWSDVVLPEAGESLHDVRSTDHERGCSPVGCSAGSWLRVGWGRSGAKPDLERAKEPPRAAVEPAPIVKWPFDCAPTGETEGSPQVGSAVRLRVRVVGPPAVPRNRAVGAELETSAWRPFLGVPAPELARDDLGFDFGTEDQVVQLRAYVWGERTAAWDRTGTWMIRAVDRFDVKRAIWSTAPSRSPWPDAAGAADVFGSDPSHRVANEWGGLYDPGGDGVLVTMRTGNALSLAVAERDHALVIVGNADDFSLDRPAGAAKVGGRWYLGAVPGPRSFHVLGIEGATMSMVGSYPRYADDAFDPPQVVRTVHGDGLGIWVAQKGRAGLTGGGDSWFIYPVDPKSGEAGPPLVVDRSAFYHPPRPCEPDEDGWLLVHPVSLSVASFEFSGVTSPPALGKVEARFIAGPAGLCIDALAGQVEGDPPKDLRPRNVRAPSRQSVELALTDRAQDRRWGFRCTP